MSAHLEHLDEGCKYSAEQVFACAACGRTRCWCCGHPDCGRCTICCLAEPQLCTSDADLASGPAPASDDEASP